MMRWFQRIPISLRVPALTALLMITLGILASQQVLTSLSGLQDDRVRETALQHISGLSVALGPQVLRKDVWEVFDTLDRARSAHDGRRLGMTIVADTSGRIIASTDPRRAAVDSKINDFIEGAVAPEDVSIAGAPILRVLAPLTYQGRPIGEILAEMDVSDLLAQRREASLYLLLGNGFGTLILSFAGYFLTARILHPLDVLSSAMNSGTGTLRPIPQAEIPRSDPEFSRLFMTYNAMADAVEARSEAERRLADRERFVSLGRLSSSLAHEINNPLGGLLNATDTLTKFSDRPEVVRQTADLLQRGLAHLRDVSRAILDENRLDRTGVPLRPEDFEDLKLLFEPEAHRNGQAMRWDLPTDGFVGPPAAPVRQVALNLLLNASAAAGPKGQLGVTVLSGAGRFALTVQDNGPGLSGADLERLVTAKPLPPGGGVGLRIVHDIVAALSGQIKHERTDGITKITVELPLTGGP
ncbi:MAG: ATP-binding protein [Cypionkella sp.]